MKSNSRRARKRFVKVVRRQERHRSVFWENNPPGPWPCYFCGQLVYDRQISQLQERRNDLLIHHIDGNHRNNAPTNLAPSHWGCHSSYTGMNLSPEARAKISKAIKGSKRSSETRAKMSVAAKANAARRRERGYTVSAEARANISKAQKGIPRPKSPETRAKISESLRRGYDEGRIVAPHLGKKFSAETRAKLSESHKGNKLSLEGKAKQSESLKRAWAEGRFAKKSPMPRASCIKCRREISINGLSSHLRACHGDVLLELANREEP